MHSPCGHSFSCSQRFAAWASRLLLLASLGNSGCADRESERDFARIERMAELDRPDMPQLGAAAAELSRFRRGDALFETVFRAADGLGPVYIRPSCAACHASDARGPGLVTRLAPSGAHSNARLEFGSVVRPYVAGPGRTPVLAETGTFERHRLPPAVFGRGHLEAVADEEIERLAREAEQRDSSIRGRIHRVTYSAQANSDRRYHAYAPGQAGLIGRFGVKARIATLDEFTADALQGDMGITSPLRPTEVPNPDGLSDDDKIGTDLDEDAVNAISDYVRLLELPVRKPSGAAGPELFAEAHCATCHAPSMRTRADYPLRELANTAVAVYTDFLLHDMGEELADGVREGDATGREWRTAPLIGLRFFPAFMHDGRAKTVEQAILAHAGEGSEANVAVERFEALTASQQRALIDFVATL